MHYFLLAKTLLMLLAIISVSMITNITYADNAYAGSIRVDTPSFRVGYKNHGSKYHKPSYRHDYYGHRHYPKRYYYRDSYDNPRHYRNRRHDRYNDYSYQRCPIAGFSLTFYEDRGCYRHKGHLHCD